MKYLLHASQNEYVHEPGVIIYFNEYRSYDYMKKSAVVV